jgi:hypothetical protein
MWTSAGDYVKTWVDELIENPPHSWLNDPRDPLFTFDWYGNPFGFYAMSLTYWSEVLFVSTYGLSCHWLFFHGIIHSSLRCFLLTRR